jgi:hypothetical protein
VPTRVDPMIRFAALVNRDGPAPAHWPALGPCHLWTGATNRGYASFRADTSGNDRVYAHLWLWQQQRGRVPAGKVLDHLCHAWWLCPGGRDCPNRRCVNLEHLQPVTHAVNNMRGSGPPGINSRKLICVHGHPRVGDNVYIHPQRGTRHCRTCQAGNWARWYVRQRAGEDQLALAI